MRRLKLADVIKIDRPFAIFVQEAFDVPGQWTAHIVGHQLDNVTCGEGPEDAVAMSLDLLCLLTGRCARSPDGQHDWSLEGRLTVTDKEGSRDIEGWKCSQCFDVWSKEDFEEC